MMPAPQAFKTCAVCGSTYTAAEFHRLEPCTSAACPDGMLHTGDGAVLEWRQCGTCPNTLVCRTEGGHRLRLLKRGAKTAVRAERNE